MAKPPDKPCDLGQIHTEFQSYFDGMNDESDRGVILASGDLLDWHLKVLARQCINLSEETSDKQKKELLHWYFDGSGIVGTFSSVIAFCFGLELIYKTTYERIQLIRGIRNNAAHSFAPISFDDESISNRLSNLTSAWPEIEEAIDRKDSSNLTCRYNHSMSPFGEVQVEIKGAPKRLKFIEAVFNTDSELIQAIQFQLSKNGCCNFDKDWKKLPDKPTSF